MNSVRNDTETTVCGQCGARFTAVGRRRSCSDVLPPIRLASPPGSTPTNPAR